MTKREIALVVAFSLIGNAVIVSAALLWIEYGQAILAAIAR